jgi:hypothetical protein
MLSGIAFILHAQCSLLRFGYFSARAGWPGQALL